MDAAEPVAVHRPPTHGQKIPEAEHEKSSRKQKSGKRTRKESQPKRASPRSLGPPGTKHGSATSKSTATRWITKAISRGNSTNDKPLLPLSERRSNEEKQHARDKRETETDKSDIAPDGSSAGREGRQFTVSNVGNNGRIYLRPSVRPAHQRFPQPNFTFPVTPPSTAVVDSWTQPSENTKGSVPTIVHHPATRLQASEWTPTPSESPLVGDRLFFTDAGPPDRPQRHRRALSDSTIHDAAVVKEPERDAYKVVISKTGQLDDRRPRTMDDLDAVAGPLLNVNIPSWRLGTPRFTLRGTPVIRGSSYAPTEDFRSSVASLFPRSARNLEIPTPDAFGRRPNPLALIPSRTPHVAQAQRGVSGLPSPRLLRPMRSTYISTHLVIEPAMFTDLTFKPACDARSIVRYSTSGAVTAATPPRLVAEITSPTFLDYELISDFFLTFRAFLEPADLLRMLVARLRWALAREDEIGMIVRVRTFVALRHWILNYFVDDFLLEYGLRTTFCTLLNDFVAELSEDSCSRRVQMKILAELKKCWRRVCAQHWDGAEFDDSLGPEVAITPGGIAGSRNPRLDPTNADADERDVGEPQFVLSTRLPQISPNAAGFYTDIPKATRVGDFVVLDNRPGTPEDQIGGPVSMEQGPTSPQSLASLDVVSCSFPNKSIRAFHAHPGHIMAAHPVSSAAVSNTVGPVATTPKALVGKRVRPTQAHKRNNSLSDSLREHDSDKASSTDQEFIVALPSGGSLVRGNLLPPGQAFVNVGPQGRYGHARRQTTVFREEGRELAKERALGGAMSGYGMRKLLRNVRKALRAKGQALSPSQSNLLNLPPVGPQGATTNRLPGTAVVPQHVPRQNGSRPAVRIDLLGAEVAEDFKKAIREEEGMAGDTVGATPGNDEHLGSMATQPPNSAPLLSRYPDYSAAHMDSTTLDTLTLNQKPRPLSDMAITVRSKSIIIVDDTVPFDMPAIHGDYKPPNPSVDTFGASFIHGGGDPTPPNTPPVESERGGTPRRSSHLLNTNVILPEANEEPLPPFIPDFSSLEGDRSTLASENPPRPSTAGTRPSYGRPPLSGGVLRLQRRTRSTDSRQSLNAILHRRMASTGSVSIQQSIRSFNATTDSGGQEPGAETDVPEPLRVLRRRPGGDLKAASNVHDLDRPIVRRSQSFGSLATYTESMRSSYMLSTRPNSAGTVDRTEEQTPRQRQDVFSLGQLADMPRKRDLSLFSTHSSKPIMRPSFEAEAQKLAQIPDEEDDGIESALLKLEGKFSAPKQMKMSFIDHDANRNHDALGSTGSEEFAASQDQLPTAEYEVDDVNEEEKRNHRHRQVFDEPVTMLSDTDEAVFINDQQSNSQRSVREIRSFLSDGTRESYCSIPLLDRELAEDTSKPTSGPWTDRSILQGSDDDDTPTESRQTHAKVEVGDGQHSSFDVIEKTDSIQRIRPGDTLPSASSEMEDDSFLRDESDDGTDLSSEISTDVLDDSSEDRRDTYRSDYGLPSHPLGDESGYSRPSAQMTLVQALAMSPDGYVPVEKQRGDSWARKPLPPTPELTPIMGCDVSPRSTSELARGHGHAAVDSKPATAQSPKLSVHLPFILAFDSNVLAQQFTLIEKDALNEIDWKELTEMNWKNSASNDSRSWVDFLKNTDAQGVEVVIARFNIMVKWAISEIVLTQHVEERARCIIKLIHIAAHCRRYRNFATLAQLTIALSSNDVARLSKTWELVPSTDLKTLSDLELLVTPSRNFHNIREEMEIATDSGCIPFVGIYTHDLLYNAQKPSEIASSPSTAPLVNFERCRVGAAIVKTLLRLLEASTKYTFQPMEGVTERCLWIGALDDEGIRRHSQGLE